MLVDFGLNSQKVEFPLSPDFFFFECDGSNLSFSNGNASGCFWACGCVFCIFPLVEAPAAANIPACFSDFTHFSFRVSHSADLETSQWKSDHTNAGSLFCALTLIFLALLTNPVNNLVLYTLSELSLAW